MLRTMHSAACSAWWHRPLAPHVSRKLAGVLAVALSSACSVYSSDLIDGAAAGIAESGSDGRGPGNGASGKSNGSGGSVNVEVPGAGGEQGSSDAGSAGAPATPSAGSTGNPGGSANGTGGTASGASGGGMPSNGGGMSGGGGGPAQSTGDLLDGFEDEDLTLEQTSGRGGVWYAFDDGSVGKTGPTPLACSPLSGAPAALGASEKKPRIPATARSACDD